MTVYTANESRVMVGGELVEGVRAIDYRSVSARTNLYALGSAERIVSVRGASSVEGRLTVASTSPVVDAATANEPFQIVTQLQHGKAAMTVTFDECFVTERTFEMGVGEHGETTYAFSAIRVRHEPA
jgi:hypothetical protein